jgi:transposase
MRYELSDYEWAAIRPMLPDKVRRFVAKDQFGRYRRHSGRPRAPRAYRGDAHDPTWTAARPVFRAGASPQPLLPRTAA